MTVNSGWQSIPYTFESTSFQVLSDMNILLLAMAGALVGYCFSK